MTPDKLAAARRMCDERERTVEAIAKILGISRTSLYFSTAHCGRISRQR